jgi:threonine dehydratase
MERVPVVREDVERAAEVIRGRLHRTPTLSCRTLGAGVLLKAELLQRTGSFKPRGVLTKLASLGPEEKAPGVIAISAGNHAQAVAWGAAEEGLDALVVMWQGASEAKVAATRGYGAAVDLEARDPAEAFERLAALLDETGRTLVHPFDDPLTIAGQGTVGLEIARDWPDVDLVFVPIGAGGLASGVAAAVKRLIPKARVIGVEPEGAASMRLALDNGSPKILPEAKTIADGLAVIIAGQLTFEHARDLVDEIVTVSDDAIRRATAQLITRQKAVVEFSGATAVAGLLSGAIDVEGRRVAAVVSGGNIDPAVLADLI